MFSIEKNSKNPVSISNEDNIDQYDSSRGGNGRVITRAEFPDRLREGIEEHGHESGAKMAGTVYFPVSWRTNFLQRPQRRGHCQLQNCTALKTNEQSAQTTVNYQLQSWTLLLFVIIDLQSIYL